MKAVIALVVACGAFAAAQARPLVVHEKSRFSNPDPSYETFGNGVGIDGDDAMVQLRRYHPPEDEFGTNEREDLAVWWFRRINDVWTPVRQVDATSHGEFYIWGGDLAMQNGVAALALNPIRIFEKRNGDWVRATFNDAEPDMPGRSVEIDSGRIIYGGSSGPFQGAIYERNASGVWRRTAVVTGEYRGGDIEFSGSPVDIQADRAVVLSPYSDADDSPATPSVAVYQRTVFGWQQDGAFIRNTPGLWPLGYETAVRGNDVFVAGVNRTGTHVFRRAAPGGFFDWTAEDHLQPLDGYMGGGTTTNIKKNPYYVLQNNWNADIQARVINVFELGTDGRYAHVATLATRDGVGLGQFAISGRRVLASCGGQVCYFQLPATISQPALVQETFSGATPTRWTLSAGSQFSIVQSGASRVLRQADTASTATHTAVLGGAAWGNQSVQADIRPTAFGGSDRWFGLATRWRNSSNYYYVTLRSSGRVSLRKNVNGVFAEIASAPLTVTVNRTYKVRLQSIGTRHHVYVDGVPMLDANDASIPTGHAALLTFRSAAEFDNVIVSPTPATTVYAFNLPRENFGSQEAFEETGTGLWLQNNEPGNFFLSQASVSGDARAVIGVPTDDQSITVRARATTFATDGSGDRWFGIAARFVDPSNYYYLSMRSGNTVSLRKVVNNSVTVLRTAPLSVAAGQWYRMRLEVIGSQVRGYVHGRLVVEATDTSLPSGKTGLVTYRTAADFDDYVAIQP